MELVFDNSANTSNNEEIVDELEAWANDTMHPVKRVDLDRDGLLDPDWGQYALDECVDAVNSALSEMAIDLIVSWCDVNPGVLVAGSKAEWTDEDLNAIG